MLWNEVRAEAMPLKSFSARRWRVWAGTLKRFRHSKPSWLARQTVPQLRQSANWSPPSNGAKRIEVPLRKRRSSRRCILPMSILHWPPPSGSSATEFSIQTWEPPGIDAVKPSVAAGVACPYQQVVDNVGERVKQFVDDVVRFSAIEELLHEQLDELGNPVSKVTRKFDYMASILTTAAQATSQSTNIASSGQAGKNPPTTLQPAACPRWHLSSTPTCVRVFRLFAKVWANGTGKPHGCSTSGSATIALTGFTNTRLVGLLTQAI